MAIKYEIVRAADGWRVHCKGVEGPAFAESSEAIRDTLSAAAQLRATGEKVEVRILEIDGPRKVWRNLEPQDAKLYR